VTERDVTGPGEAPSPTLAPEEEPVTTGTLFLTMIILMVIAAVWVIVYRLLLGR
jgi:hypothetical protein